MKNFKPVVVSTTSDDRDVLDRMAKTLVDRKLAACVQISGPINSCYSWQDKVETCEEFTCSIKTSSHLQSEIESVVNELHNYDLPQLIVVQIIGGSEAYLNWMQTCLHLQQ